MTQTDPVAAKKIKSERWVLEEKPFTSSVPVVGGLIVGFRNAWNSVAAKWYIRRIAQQQTRFNLLFAQLIDHLNSQLVSDSKENSEFSHDLAEMTVLLTSIKHSLESLEERISLLEQTHHNEEG
jgi:hypothetical protein